MSNDSGSGNDSLINGAAIYGTQQRDSQGPSGYVESSEDDMAVDKPTEEEKSILLERKDQKGEIIQVKEQTNEERQAIRTELESIKEKLKEAAEDATVMSPSEVEGYINRCNAIYDKIQHAREGAQDQELMTLASEIVKKMASKLETSHRKFDPAEFAQKIKAFYTGKSDNAMEEDSDEESDGSEQSLDIEGRNTRKKRKGMEIKRDDWAQVGRFAWSILMECPALSFVNGSFDADEVEVRERQKKERQKRQVDAPLKKLQKKTGEKEIDSQEKTLMMVDKLWKQLRQRCRGGQSISYFEVVLDPRDFGKTVENMFHVSFLVKDYKVKMELDDDGLPILTVVEERAGTKSQHQSRENKQCIMSITMQEWEELVEVYEIKEPFVVRA